MLYNSNTFNVISALELSIINESSVFIQLESLRNTGGSQGHSCNWR